MKKLLYLIIVLALIFGCIDDIFATNYKQMGKVYPQGNFSSDCYTKIYETTLDANATTVAISGLLGNTTVEYKLEIAAVSANNGNVKIRLNNDAGDNYGEQWVVGNVNSTYAARGHTTCWQTYYNVAGTTGHYSQHQFIIYAKSGYVRTGLQETLGDTTGTTVGEIFAKGISWNNSTAEITEIDVLSDAASGLGIGTYICLWGKEYKQ